MVVEVDVQGDIIPEESLSEMAGTAVHVHFVDVEIFIELFFGPVVAAGGVEGAKIVPLARAAGALIIIDIDMMTSVLDLFV